mmetsp:Transcript_22947/g.78157  ORF Transcript_22947/g.78157 Transcript_22947/m.78157 type:complete len:692 (-) Transcript_22947:107-2182(-)|eukprot:CAMPEP_0203894796 /NCGR_PEP_ID=MMETSP0359-20131031/37713_1 /ASSEMBLY_ACC=CAM_ASM_000338 /TAXON_ID=268821 /ORGANISM="Scrippsiella Hangoei, Strain SHTV-5" /LENGTH=691 /DNA_ID=CAMNT_0050817173 /DNA_START=50 /DNA_END=2125 /DNA_ORIENTATION=+
MADAEVEADRAEMAAVLAGCKSQRLRQELQNWPRPVFRPPARGAEPMAAASAEAAAAVEADCAEMSALLQTCGRTRVRHELDPWLSRAREELGRLRLAAPEAIAAAMSGGALPAGPSASSGAPAPSLAPAAADGQLDTVVIAGARGTGKRRLLGALVGAADGAYAAADGGGEILAEGVLETKYYVARVRYQVIDLVPGSETVLPSGAEAYLLLWDSSRPETFELAQASARCSLPGCAEGGDDAAAEEEEEGVRLCIAAQGLPGSQGSTAQAQKCEDAARWWCSESGFECLACPFGEDDFAALHGRLDSNRAGSPAGMLDDDTDGTLLRILEALECHSWPNLELKPKGGNSAGASAAAARLAVAPAEPRGLDLPLVVAAGAPGLGQHELVQAMAGVEVFGDRTVEAELNTKYYRARLSFCAVDLDLAEDSADVPEQLRSASAVLLLCAVGHQVNFDSMCRLYAGAWPSDVADEADKDQGQKSDARALLRLGGGCGAGVRLLVAVGDGGGSCGKDHTAWENKARLWCAENGLEFVRCTLDGASLEAVAARWRVGGRGGAPLLAEPDAEGAAALRIVEALECHAWPNMEMQTSTSSSTAGRRAAATVAEGGGHVPEVAPSKAAAAEVSKAKGVQRLDDCEEGCHSAENTVEAIGRFADEIRSVRATADEGARRDKACDLAMKLAEAFGVDSDSD